MLNSPSWADALHAADTPQDKAKVLLTRALGRGSKNLIAGDIAEALTLLEYHTTSPQELLETFSLPWTQIGLHTAAERLLKAIWITEYKK